MSEYGAITPDRLGQLLAENTRLTRELAEAVAQRALLADQVEELTRINQTYDKPFSHAFSNGA